QEGEPRPVAEGLADVGAALPSISGDDPRAGIEEDDQRDEDSAHRRGERPQRPTALDLRQHDAERYRAGREYSRGNVEQRATDNRAPVVRLGEPTLGRVETEVRTRGHVEVSDAQPANGREQNKDPVAPKSELLGAKSSWVLHSYSP